jgi:hypothetical protein
MTIFKMGVAFALFELFIVVAADGYVTDRCAILTEFMDLLYKPGKSGEEGTYEEVQLEPTEVAMGSEGADIGLADQKAIGLAFEKWLSLMEVEKNKVSDLFAKEISVLMKTCDPSQVSIPKVSFLIFKLLRYAQVPTVGSFLSEFLASLENKQRYMYITYSLKIIFNAEDNQLVDLINLLRKESKTGLIGSFIDIYRFAVYSSIRQDKTEFKNKSYLRKYGD